MLTSETKNKLNSVKNVLVGKIPDPKGQVDQITNALIYKFMDDQDRLSMSVPGGKASFFVGELEGYAWHKLFDSKLSNQDRADLYIKGLDKLSTATKLPELFRDIFKNAYLPFRAPDTIAMFLDVINTFDYHHPEELGNAFEHLLSIMGSQGDAGQFRTPRHIIEFIVKVVAPKKDETIFDPACGTAGFLVEAFNQIKNGSKLTPQELQLLANNIEGFDIDPGMAKLARVNLYLHGFKTPHITENDTLTNENLWLKKKYDVILANPPFMSPKGGIKPHDKFSVKANKSEVLFVNYIAEHLKLHGRAGIIVPEGVIFQSSSSAYKQLRKLLVEDGYLSAVVSLPSGVFNPYSGVKTSILILDRERAKSSNEILFVKVENDGYDLGAQRRPIKRNDLPEALDVLNKWQNGQKLDADNVVYVEKTKISANGEYVLSMDRYRATSDYSDAEWSMVKLEDVLDYEQPTDYIVNSTDYNDDYEIPVLTAGKTFLLGYTNESEGVFRSGLPVIIFDDFTTATKFVNFPFKVKSSAMKILHAQKDKINIRYAYYVMQNIDFRPGEHKRYWISEFSKFKIPLPPLEIQEQIVTELDGYQRIIDGAKQVVENWKPSFSVNSEWEKIKIGDEEFIKVIDGDRGSNYPSKEEFKTNGYCLFLNTSNVRKGNFDFSACDFISKEKDELLRKGKLSRGDVVLTTRGTLGNTAYYSDEIPFEHVRINSGMVLLRCDNEKILPRFLLTFLNSKNFIDQVYNQMSGSAQPQLPIGTLNKIELYVPDIKTQKEIVEKIEAEKLLVESNKKLIEIYEQKMKDVISKLWK